MVWVSILNCAFISLSSWESNILFFFKACNAARISLLSSKEIKYARNVAYTFRISGGPISLSLLDSIFAFLY